MNCINCNTELSSNYCPDCGQPSKLKRINAHYIVHEIEHVLHFERGIFHTIRELVVHPGRTIKRYLNENRSRLVKPIAFIVITSLVYSIAVNFFHVEDHYVNLDDRELSDKMLVTTSFFKWVQGHYGYANILMGIFIAFWTKLFFRKYEYNFFELLILLCFVMGIGMLIYAVFGIIEGLTHTKVMQIAGMIGLGYTVWAIGNFFNKNKVSSYLKALASYLLGMLTFLILSTVITITIDILIKH